MTTRTYQTEFPDFTLDVQIPAGLFDTSWCCDVCPSWSTGSRVVFVDYADVSMRELQKQGRFTVIGPQDECLYQGDDFDAAIAALTA
jgi:hypothetical protein